MSAIRLSKTFRSSRARRRLYINVRELFRFCNSLTKPQVIIIAMDEDSGYVDRLINSVVVYLEERDLIIDASLSSDVSEAIDSDVSEAFIEYVEKALCASVLSTYIQGIKMIEAREKSVVNILRDIVKVWKVNCLIDPRCLDDLYMAYNKYHKYKLEDFILEPCQFKEKGDNEGKEMNERMTKVHSA
ncbi:hypothetical protein Tco_0240716 [Tanacetum coccineum]